MSDEEGRALEPEELELLLNTPKEIQDKALLILLYGTGVLVEEAAELKLDDISLLNQIVNVRGRVVPISSLTVSNIRQFIEERRRGSSENSSLFIGENDQPLSVADIRERMRTYLEMTERIDPSLADTEFLRLTSKKHLIEICGISPGAVREILGEEE